MGWNVHVEVLVVLFLLPHVEYLQHHSLYVLDKLADAVDGEVLLVRHITKYSH